MQKKFFHCPDTKIAALGADSVLPAYRGNSLNKIMIAYRLELAKHFQCQRAASIIDRSNHWNMPPYFKNGFQMFGSAVDPADGGKIALMSHNLQTELNSQEQNHIVSTQPKISIPFNRFDVIDKLFENGFVGCSYNQETASITFMPQTENVLTDNRVKYNWKILSSGFKPALEY